MFNVAEWRIPAYESISRRSTPLTTEEASRLPVDDVTIIYALRQYITTDSGKFRALLKTLGMYFVSNYISISLLYVYHIAIYVVKNQAKLNYNPTKTLSF
jgi:hypothetical protein